MKFRDIIEEATLVNDAERGLQIRPSGGMGSWSEDGLRKSIEKDLADIAFKIKGKGTKMAETILNGAAFQSKIKALAQFEEYMSKKGKKPIAQDKEIKIGE